MTINPIDHPQQWGAWLSYYKAKGITMALFSQRGQQAAQLSNPEQRAEKGYQVPASMPSDFDADRDWLDDKLAGDKFIAAQQAARSAAKETPSGDEIARRMQQSMAAFKRQVAKQQQGDALNDY